MRREGVTVIIMVEAHASFEVHLTPASVDDMQLKQGAEVWVIIKTYSCNLVEPSLERNLEAANHQQSPG